MEEKLSNLSSISNNSNELLNENNMKLEIFIDEENTVFVDLIKYKENIYLIKDISSFNNLCDIIPKIKDQIIYSDKNIYQNWINEKRFNNYEGIDLTDLDTIKLKDNETESVISDTNLITNNILDFTLELNT